MNKILIIISILALIIVLLNKPPKPAVIIGDIRVFDKGLDDVEIQKLYNGVELSFGKTLTMNEWVKLEDGKWVFMDGWIRVDER